jgi:hypothetical protein
MTAAAGFRPNPRCCLLHVSFSGRAPNRRRRCTVAVLHTATPSMRCCTHSKAAQQILHQAHFAGTPHKAVPQSQLHALRHVQYSQQSCHATAQHTPLPQPLPQRTTDSAGHRASSQLQCQQSGVITVKPQQPQGPKAARQVHCDTSHVKSCNHTCCGMTCIVRRAVLWQVNCCCENSAHGTTACAGKDCKVTKW